ncbi:hypothetical protein [Methylosinus sp. KRF6]|uniref:hypothetical protein n=1 Tax=Methylosinus sp. KRF6 TaxID=2846853 RepID=UPI001C0E01A2|nr:hypothetical protein [Methylosinus sp. KRF6]MBU3889720.1 hypothetical protein [Methylosinus sp. KRF6]
MYHQGGLDTYCGFYAILNLVNFLKFKENRSTDFIGAPGFHEKKPFERFSRFIDAGGFRGFFPERPFGDTGLESQMMKDALSRALSLFYVRGEVKIEEDLSQDPYGRPPDAWESYFRPGTETRFANAEDVLGLTVVQEDHEDDIGHWVVFIGKNHLEDTALTCKDGWDGIVLDSERGYEFWKVDKGRILLLTQRNEKVQEIATEWIYSFVSLSLS